MDNQLLEIKESYYEYASKLSSGITIIINLLRDAQINEALLSIANFAEGVEVLSKIEQILNGNGYNTNSRIDEAKDMFNEINQALENQDYILLADLFEYEILPLFISASEWGFKKV